MHEMDHRQIDKTFSHFGVLFIILTQATKAIEPTKSAFNNPAFWQNLKTFLFTAMSDFCLYTKQLLTPVQQGITGIATIKNKQSQSREKRQSYQEPTDSDFVLFISRMNKN